MSDQPSFKHIFDKTKDQEVWVPCTSCGQETAHRVLCSVRQSGFNPVAEVHFDEECQIILCQGCKTISFRREYWDSESDGPWGRGETVKLYPSRLSVRKILKDKYDLPPQILRVYEETNTALCSGQLVLAGIGIRALVESVCKERGAAGGNLEQNIDDMVGKGTVTKDGAEILHSTRLMGNQAAHEVTAHKQDVLENAMDIVEHMLSAVYIIPHKADGLPKRKKGTP
jgi:hypothetical protein